MWYRNQEKRVSSRIMWLVYEMYLEIYTYIDRETRPLHLENEGLYQYLTVIMVKNSRILGFTVYL